MYRNTGAYFTVEAALIMPMVLGTVLLIVYLMFFQYDRCLMEQDLGALMLKGVVFQAADNEQRMKELKMQECEIDRNKYIAWEVEEAELKLERSRIYVKQRGYLQFPFRGWNFWGENSIWETEIVYENAVRSPTSIIRKYRKLTGGE